MGTSVFSIDAIPNAILQISRIPFTRPTNASDHASPVGSDISSPAPGVPSPWPSAGMYGSFVQYPAPPPKAQNTDARQPQASNNQAPLLPTGFMQYEQGALIAVYQPEALEQYMATPPPRHSPQPPLRSTGPSAGSNTGPSSAWFSSGQSSATSEYSLPTAESLSSHSHSQQQHLAHHHQLSPFCISPSDHHHHNGNGNSNGGMHIPSVSSLHHVHSPQRIHHHRSHSLPTKAGAPSSPAVYGSRAPTAPSNAPHHNSATAFVLIPTLSRVSGARVQYGRGEAVDHENGD